MKARSGKLVFCCLFVGSTLTSVALSTSPTAATSRSYADLLTLFEDWRAFERPPRAHSGAVIGANAVTASRAISSCPAPTPTPVPPGWPLDPTRVKPTAGVLGGGFMGLCAALRLAQAGRRVTLFEAAPEPGGVKAWVKPGGEAQDG